MSFMDMISAHWHHLLPVIILVAAVVLLSVKKGRDGKDGKSKDRRAK